MSADKREKGKGRGRGVTLNGTLSIQRMPQKFVKERTMTWAEVLGRKKFQFEAI